MKLILFIGGGDEALPAVKLAKSIGFKTAVIDLDPSCICFKYSDFNIICSTYDVNGCIKLSQQFNDETYKISGVISVASDVPNSVASVAKSLNIPGIPIKAALISSDKMLMKDIFKKNNIEIPWYKEIFSYEDLLKIISKNNKQYVIKPVDSRGSRGVQKIDSNSNLKLSYEEALNYSPSKRVMIEEFISGPQISSESLIFKGKSYTIGLSDRNYELLEKYAPNIIEDGGDLPASLDKEQVSNIEKIIEKIAKILKINNGVIKGDIVFNKDSSTPIIIEVATRLSGGYFCTHEIPLNTGVDFVGNAIKIALGENINLNELEPTEKNCVCQRYLFAKEGIVTKIPNMKKIELMPGIKLAKLRVDIGDKIDSPKSHPGRSGVIIAVGENRVDAQNNAKNAILEMKKNLIIKQELK
tara:strand:- start:1789 stop:3027 length:1239 start_codon:yes stop_codon:yes gene_type:complete